MGTSKPLRIASENSRVQLGVKDRIIDPVLSNFNIYSNSANCYQLRHLLLADSSDSRNIAQVAYLKSEW